MFRNYYKTAIKFDNNLIEAYTNLGIVYEHSGKYNDAAGEYKKALAINPNFEIALLNLGAVFLIREDFYGSLNHLQRLTEINPTRGPAYYYTAVAQYFIHDYKSSWQNVHTAQSLGSAVDVKFIETLSSAMSEQDYLSVVSPDN